MQNSYNLPMRGIFWCSYLGEEIYSLVRTIKRIFYDIDIDIDN